VPKTAYSPSTFVVGDLGQTVGAHLARLGRLRGRAVVNIEALVVAGQAASPDAELQALFGNMVDGRDILGQPERVTQRQGPGRRSRS
jgi:hypothetical protein